MELQNSNVTPYGTTCGPKVKLVDQYSWAVKDYHQARAGCSHVDNPTHFEVDGYIRSALPLDRRQLGVPSGDATMEATNGRFEPVGLYGQPKRW